MKFFNFFNFKIPFMSKKKDKPEEKKPAVKKLTPAETQTLEIELNTVELNIIKFSNNPDKVKELEQEKLIVLEKLGRKSGAEWKR